MSDVLTIEEPSRVELEVADGMSPPDAAARQLAKYLFMVRGKTVADVCCGTGYLAITAAKLGAREVWATDSDPAAIECTRRNVGRNDVKVFSRRGDLLKTIRYRKYDVIIADPPQIPAPLGVEHPAFGGDDGLRFLSPLVREAHDCLEDGGELLTLVLSFADTRRFEGMLAQHYRFRSLPRSKREFSASALDALHPGVTDHLRSRRDRGAAEFEEEDGRITAWVRYYMAMKK